MMDVVVLDASAGLRLVIPGEAGQEEARRVYAGMMGLGLMPIVPDLYAYEAGQVVSRSVGPAAEKVRLYMDALELAEVARPSPDALARAQALAADRKLSFYDAAYLALAEDRNALLWTEDREILKRFPGRATATADLLQRLGAPG